MVEGVHASLDCVACHVDGGRAIARPGRADNQAAGCVGCHAGTAGVFDGPMTTRIHERESAGAALDSVHPQLFERRCSGCHVATCGDCHGQRGHALATATPEDCHRCHRGVFIGADYLGLAPREDAVRYQRGEAIDGERYLRMAPDVHALIGMSCGACHDMASLARGEKASRSCQDCHTPSQDVPEHAISEHLERMTCQACHAAWVAQEYGTFLLEIDDPEARTAFRLRPGDAPGRFTSAYLRQQGLPPLGLDASGRVSPIRPEFILYLTETRGGAVVGRENRLVTADWKAVAPHTIQRGGPVCEACHDDRRRFIDEPADQRIYDLARDGLGLTSFWRPEGQRVINGAFYPAERFTERMATRGPRYLKAALARWRGLIGTLKAPGSPAEAPPGAGAGPGPER